MANNITQVGLIQIRQGKAEQLPYALEEGEFGLATDTLELFIGAPNSQQLNNRYNNKIYPYGNLRILTELSEPLEIQKYRYEGNTKIKAMFPIILKGSTNLPTVTAGTQTNINSVTLTFDEDTGLTGIIDKINQAHIPFTNAYSMNNCLVIVSTDNNLKIVNTQGKFIQDTGLSSDESIDEIGISAEDLIETTLQAVLDDYLTIKHYNVKGDGLTDDTININNGLLGTYCVDNTPSYLRTVYFPSGEYITTSQINIPSNARLLGEGKGRTIIKSGEGAYGNMIGFLDDLKKPSNADDFGGENINPKNITIEGITFDGSEIIDTIVEFANCTDVTFRDCEFKNCNGSLVTFRENEYTNLHIAFDNCDFINADYGVETGEAKVEHMSIMNSHFNDIGSQAIVLGENTYKTNLINDCFMDCSALVNEVILINGERTVLVHSHFDDSVDTFESTPIPFTDTTDTIYTDILDPHGLTEDMVYKFSYPQAKWGFVDKLQNSRGEYIIKPVYGDNDEEIINWIYIKPGNTTTENIEIFTEDKFQNLVVDGGHYANIILGQSNGGFNDWSAEYNYSVNDYVEHDGVLYKCVLAHTSSSITDLNNTTLWNKVTELSDLQVILAKNLNLNGKVITDNTGDITFRPQGNSVVVIDDDNYAEKIDSVAKAVATVEYVKSNIANKTISTFIDMSNYMPSENWNRIALGTIDSISYGDSVYVKSVSVSVENIFRDLNFAQAIDWESGTLCYKGSLYKHEGSYYVSKMSHTNINWNEGQWSEVDVSGINPVSIRLYAQQGSNIIEMIPAGDVKTYEKEETFPQESSYNNDTVRGNVYYYSFARYTNVSDYTFYIEITDANGNLATNWQPSGQLFSNIDIFIK